MTTANHSGIDLSHIQRWMQAVIMHPLGISEGMASAEARRHIDITSEQAETVITRSRALSAQDRLFIYGSAYYARLLECLREEFPVLMHALGQEVFDAFAAGYLQHYPSRSYTLFQLAANFPRYLAETRPMADAGEGLPADWPEFLIDLATLECAFNEVFDGPGVEGETLLNVDQLRSITPERLLDAHLVGVPCLRLLILRNPVHKYFTAVRRNEDPDPPGPAETWLAVTRRNYVVRHYELSRPAFVLLDALLGGARVGAAIEQTAALVADADLERLSDLLSKWFHDWAAEGLFRAVEIAN
jgi:Putative DNA-binding domain